MLDILYVLFYLPLQYVIEIGAQVVQVRKKQQRLFISMIQDHMANRRRDLHPDPFCR